MTTASTTIGLFDSGFGGLTVAREVRRQMPSANIEYYGDSGRAPYGPRTREEIVRMTRQCVDFLATKNVDLIIIACNTTTAAALDELSGAYSFPVIGVIGAGAEAAVATTRNNKVGVIATQFTIESEAHKNAIQKLHPEINVIGKACPSFSPLVEAGKAESPEAERDAKEYLSVYKDSGIDTLVFGCTHYPLLHDVVRRNVPSGVTFVDPAVETVKQARAVLSERRTLTAAHKQACSCSGKDEHGQHTECSCKAPTYNFYTSGDPIHFERFGSQFFGVPTGRVKKVTLE